MKYLCTVYVDEKKLNALSTNEYEQLVAKSLAYDDVLRRSGHLIAAHPLEPVSAATTLRIRDGEVLLTDGPFAETKEQLGGFLLIEAADMKEAIELASKAPPAVLGSIEVRPVRDMTVGHRRGQAANPSA